MSDAGDPPAVDVTPVVAQTFQQFVESQSWVPSEADASALAKELAEIPPAYRCTYENFKRAQRAVRGTDLLRFLKECDGKINPFHIVSCLRAVQILSDADSKALFSALLELICPDLGCKTSNEPRVPKDEAYRMFHTAAEAAVSGMPAPHVEADASAETYYMAQLKTAFQIDFGMHLKILSMQFKHFRRQLLTLQSEIASIKGKKRPAEAESGDKKGTFVCPDWAGGKCKIAKGEVCSKGKHSASISTLKFLNKLLDLGLGEEELKKRASE